MAGPSVTGEERFDYRLVTPQGKQGYLLMMCEWFREDRSWKELHSTVPVWCRYLPATSTAIGALPMISSSQSFYCKIRKAMLLNEDSYQFPSYQRLLKTKQRAQVGEEKDQEIRKYFLLRAWADCFRKKTINSSILANIQYLKTCHPFSNDLKLPCIQNMTTRAILQKYAYHFPRTLGSQYHSELNSKCWFLSLRFQLVWDQGTICLATGRLIRGLAPDVPILRS